MLIILSKGLNAQSPGLSASFARRIIICESVHVNDGELVDAASTLFKALSSPVRIAIVRTLDLRGPLCVHELVLELGAAQSLVSQHLRVLRSADVVRGTRRGKEIAYDIADAHVAQIVRKALDHIQEEHS